MTTSSTRQSHIPLRQMLYGHIDQLDLALDQLALRDANFDRFAILLVDNVVELTLHRYAVDQKATFNPWDKSGQSQINPKVLGDALGQKFDAKVALASQTGLLSQPMSQSINWLHTFRNTSYHSGLRHEGILNSLANLYLRICCDLLAEYKPRFWSSGSEKMSHRAAKYLGSTEVTVSAWITKNPFDEAWARLKSVALSMNCSLIADLARDMGATIQSVDDQINHGVAYKVSHLESHPRDVVVTEAQFMALAYSKKGVEYAKENGYAGTGGPSLQTWFRQNYKLQISTDPIPKWRRRLGKLEKEKDEHAGLNQYCNFIQQTHSIRDDISQQNEFFWREIDDYSERFKPR
ncbi:hypothetical protein [Stenotrophomonas maltophilia]|uniref:hypothetical protein n=1 Tax=Stenotrophomonas maltophilia TaxID=40324 RepID=UPI001FA77059|nr:hypothetical protein [Stenotrophomonas maltophilia]